MKAYTLQIKKAIRRHENRHGRMVKKMKFLSGKKTYLTAVVMVVLSGLKASGYIDEATYQLLMGVAGACGLTFLRMGVTK